MVYHRIMMYAHCRPSCMRTPVCYLYDQMNQPGHTAGEAVDAICPSYLVELSVVTSSGQEGVGEDMKNFAEQLKPYPCLLILFVLNCFSY